MPEDGSKGIGSLSDTLRKVPAIAGRMPEVGDVFAGRYDIQRLLGRGGMGIVYLANQSPLGRQVAVKILKPPETLEDDPNFDERFLREAAAAARLQHPNTITVHDFGQADDGSLYIVMEYLEGNDVRQTLSHEGAFAPARAIHVAKQVCKSLREAHRKGIIHRDLKPANVLLVHRDEDDDFVKVLDFGLVKFRGEASEITLAGKFLGSPRYTSPEALDRTKEVDHRADIYAVGILIYAMITGRPPFDGDPMQVLHAHLHETPKAMWKLNPAAQTSPELEALVARCLEKEPDKRFQSMGELVLALRSVGAAFGQEDTETLDLEVSESLELDPEPGSIPRRSKTDPLAVVPPEIKTRREPAPVSSSVVTEQPLRPLRRRRKSKVPLIILGGIALLLVGAIAFVLLSGDTSTEDGEEGLAAPDPSDIQMDSNSVSITVVTTPPGAEVRVGFDGQWTLLGNAPIELDSYTTPEEFSIVGVKVTLDGYEPVDVVVPVEDGVIRWEGSLTAQPVLAPTPVAKPRPAPAARPKPVAKPQPKPAAQPTPAAKPKPTDAKRPADKDSVPAGYKDNPY